MKRIFIIIGIGITTIFICILLAIHIWIGTSVKANINKAKQQYPGSSEGALIEFLLDENNTPNDRTHIAIWTLGQIRSEKALPILNRLYINNPKDETCYGKHESKLCQYKIHKAIVAIEKNWWFSQARLKKFD